MKNRKGLKVALVALAMVLVCVLSVLGTIAYLTSQQTVTNTFTVGQVEITMDEAPVDEDGNVITGDRVTENDYKLLPGHTYTKDPIIHIAEDSVESYLFVTIVDEIAAIQDDETVIAQMEANGWAPLDGVAGVYVYESTVSGEDADLDIEVFEYFKVKDDIDNETLAVYENKTIVVKAYAVQKDGFDTAASAWNSTFGA